jgi:hypothetical protein
LVTLALDVCSGKPPQASSFAPVPDGFDAWFARAVAPRAEDRFPTARMMAEELRGLCGQIPMLWEPDAAAPSVHSTREKTELEPVLELTRRSQGGQADEPRLSVTQVDSVRNVFRTPAPIRRRRRWLGGMALFAIAGIIALTAPDWGVTSLDTARAKLHEVRSPFRGSGERQADDAANTAASVAAPVREPPPASPPTEVEPAPKPRPFEPAPPDAARADAGSRRPRNPFD